MRTLRRALWHLRTGGPRQLRTHLERRNATSPVLHAVRETGGQLTFDPWPLPVREPRRQLRVAVVLDDFSRLALAYEWQQVEIRPESWKEQVIADPVDLLLVESAWQGNGGAWAFQLTGPSAPRPALVELVGWCRDNGVPSVFWNKEDPVHYADFLPVARLFDHVLTTDAGRVPDYVRDLGHDRVGVLPFAVQPALHNPVRLAREHQARDVAFAGTWFAEKYPERRAQLEMLLGAAEDVSERLPHGLEIFSRFLGDDARYQFPEPFDRQVVGSLDYRRVLSAYRSYKVFLNVNTVTTSPTMCARRVLEVTACGTPVVTTPGAAIPTALPTESVTVVDDRADARHMIRALVRSPELRDRMVHLGQRRIWSEHTCSHRVDTVLAAAGLRRPPTRRASVSVLVATNRPGLLDALLTTVASQRDIEAELVLLTHGFEVPANELRARARDVGIGSVQLITADERHPLGQCLNDLVTAAGGEVLAKIDDDDRYGPHYLSDQLHALEYSRAEVVGKQAHFMYLTGRDATILRFPEREHRFTDLVSGPTLVLRREVALRHPFPAVTRGEDTGILRDVVAAGGRVYSSDRYNFVQVRGGARHTWDVTDAELLANADVKYFGEALQNVMI